MRKTISELGMNTAFLFPGQASQKVGMGLDLYNSTDLGRRYFDEANEIIGVDIQDITFNGPEEKLKQTQYTQPAIYIVSVILGKLLLEKGIRPAAVAGHSLGEYSALTIAGAFDFKTGLKLVKIRAESMQTSGEQNPGTMAAIMNIPDEDVISVCKDCADLGIVIPANFNAPGQVVISGEVKAVYAAMEKAKAVGARKVVELNVSGAFHSSLMRPAREALAEILNSIEIKDTVLPVYSNISAQPVTKADEVMNGLTRQLESPVLWHKTITNMKKQGINQFLEVGPGRVLQGLNRRIDRHLTSMGVATLDDINKYV